MTDATLNSVRPPAVAGAFYPGTAVVALRGLPQVCVSDEAHTLEHSLEVHLPFLQQTLAAFTLVPLATKTC